MNVEWGGGVEGGGNSNQIADELTKNMVKLSLMRNYTGFKAEKEQEKQGRVKYTRN